MVRKTTIHLNIAIKAMIWGVCRPKASLSVFSPLGQAALEGRRIGAGDKNVKLSGLDRFARRVCNAEVGSSHWVLGLLNKSEGFSLGAFNITRFKTIGSLRPRTRRILLYPVCRFLLELV